MYKLILSDLDETLLVEHHVPEFNIKAIKKAQKQGVKFVPATGRAYFMTEPILKELDLDDREGEYSICFNGGLIVENKNKRILNFKYLDFDVAKTIFNEAKKYDVCVIVFTIDMCYIYRANKAEVARKIKQKAPFKIIDDFSLNNLKGQKIAKILFAREDMDYLKKIGNDLKDIVADKATLSYSSNRYLEFNALGIDKGFGLRWLANYLKLDISETIAIGDNYNDEEMIKTAGLGACVASSHDEIKASANYVTKLDYDQGAVKEVIEKFVLEAE